MSGNTLANNTEFAARLRDSVRAQLGLLIPEDQWDEYVQKEVAAFFTENSLFKIKEVRTKNSYGHDTGQVMESLECSVSPFRLMVWEEVHKIYKERIKDIFASPEFRDPVKVVWGTHSERITAELTEKQEAMLREAMPDMMVNVLKGMMGVAIQTAGRTLYESMTQNRIPSLTSEKSPI